MVITEQILNAKLEVAEARTDVKFAQLLTEVKLIGRDVAGLTTSVADLKTGVESVKTLGSSMKWNVFSAALTIGLTLGGLILALLAFGTQILDLSTSLLGAKQ
jgi:hypothetical protein